MKKKQITHELSLKLINIYIYNNYKLYKLLYFLIKNKKQ